MGSCPRLRLPILLSCKRPTNGSARTWEDHHVLDRRHLTLAGIGAAIAAAVGTLTRSGSQQAVAASGTFDITKTDDEWRKLLTADQYYVLRKHGTERAGTSPLDKEYRRRHVRLRRLRSAPVLLQDQVRQPHRLAELLCPARQCRGHDQRPQLGDAPHRGALPPLRRSPWSCVRGWTQADRAALLHERRGDEVHSGRQVVLGESTC